MPEKSTIFVPNKRNVRVSKLGDKDLRELGWVAPDGSALLHVQHHVDSCYWRAVFPLVDGRVPLGSGPTLRAAYREAYRQHRLLRRAPERVARSRATALRTAWKYRQQARRYAETVNRLTRELRAANALNEARRERDQKDTTSLLGALAYEGSLREQLDAANAKLSAEYGRAIKQSQQYRELQANYTGLLARYATLQGRCDDLARQLGLPTSAELAVPPKPAPSASSNQEVTHVSA